MTTDPTYEATFAQLQALVTKLERGDLGMESVMAHYEDGVKLAAQCQELLKATEDKIRRIQMAYSVSQGLDISEGLDEIIPPGGTQ